MDQADKATLRLAIGLGLATLVAYGLAILTSNLKTAIDQAFQRRLRFIVHFPFPDAELREAIWRGVFPAATPVAALDYARLARLHAAGGSIRNIAVSAAFLAAASDHPLGMDHLFRAAHAEAAKGERALSDAETKGWI